VAAIAPKPVAPVLVDVWPKPEKSRRPLRKAKPAEAEAVKASAATPSRPAPPRKVDLQVKPEVKPQKVLVKAPAKTEPPAAGGTVASPAKPTQPTSATASAVARRVEGAYMTGPFVWFGRNAP
jgi:hypothetical protein